MSETRVGIGRDIHRLFPGKPLVLGGALVTEDLGFDTHSDGDVLCHAIIDALAGAIAEGDLGTHFPEDDPDTADARSIDFLKEFGRLVNSRGYEILGLDAFIVLGPVKLRPHITEMRTNVADALQVDPGRISIKARSNDGIPPEGTGEAASATVAVLLQSQ